MFCRFAIASTLGSHCLNANVERRPDRMVEPPVFLIEPVGLPCCGGRFGLSQFGHDAELQHQAQSIPVDPAFRHLSANEADDAYSGHSELLPRWRDSIEIALMGAAASPARNNCLALGNRVFDRQSKVWECRAVQRHSLLLTFGPAPHIGRRRIVVM